MISNFEKRYVVNISGGHYLIPSDAFEILMRISEQSTLVDYTSNYLNKKIAKEQRALVLGIAWTAIVTDDDEAVPDAEPAPLAAVPAVETPL